MPLPDLTKEELRALRSYGDPGYLKSAGRRRAEQRSVVPGVLHLDAVQSDPRCLPRR
jgi:hypothetical protein